MADLVPAGGETGRSLLAPLTDAAGGSLPARLGRFLNQGPVRRALPWFGGIAAAGLAGLLWLEMAPAPQRVLYSTLNDSERAQEWRRIRSGEATVVVATRSGVFSPVQNLGLILVDEEHDSSFKQQDSFFYHYIQELKTI